MRSLHSGPHVVQALIQQQFWIIGCRSLLRSRIHKCITCVKFHALKLQPPMGDLPVARVTISRPFSHVGTDFAGPFQIKFSSRRNSPSTKGYLCLFVCLATKAVHLEFVSALSMNAFIATLERFVARRGLPSHIYSDNGTNFVGAAKHLRQVSQFLTECHTQLFDYFSAHHITWHFNPPHAPNFGGLWEAAVKSSKSLFNKLLTSSAYTFEEYSTIFSRIEAILNSRPLCRTLTDPGIEYLTPGHFLIGSPLVALPEKTSLETSSYHSRWEHLRQIHQAYWKRWSTEYLNTLQVRTKWTSSSPTIQVGDLVLLTGMSSPPTVWPIGRVVGLFPGPDGITRVVSVKTSKGIYKRPISKLVLVP